MHLFGDHVGSWRWMLSRHGCNGWHNGWPGDSCNSHCRHKADELLVGAADVWRLRMQHWRKLFRLMTSILAIELALHCFSPFYDFLDFVYALVVATCPADRLNKVVQHRPRASRNFAQEAFLSSCRNGTVGYWLSCSRGHHHYMH